MSARTLLRVGLVFGVALACALSSSRARAADDDAEDEGGLRGPRIAVVPAVGVGIGAFTGQRAPFPSVIGMSVSTVELSYEGARWGGFGRGGYLSSGENGRWTAPVVALGASYRIGGDGEETWGLVPRGGLVFQRWHANSAGCPVPFFFPDNCKAFALTTPDPSGTVTPTAANDVTTVDTLGLFFGMRAEIPVSPVFLAFGAEMSTTVDLSQASPGLVWTGQLTFAFGLRNHQSGNASTRTTTDPARYRNRGTPGI